MLNVECSSTARQKPNYRGFSEAAWVRHGFGQFALRARTQLLPFAASAIASVLLASSAAGAALDGSPRTTGHHKFSCQTFIGDGRGLLVRVRELATYPIIASAVAIGSSAPAGADDLTFDWQPFDGDWDSSLDQQSDAWLPGHAYLHTGSHERTITVHARAYWRRGQTVTACSPAQQSYEVGSDYEAFASLGYLQGHVSNELSAGNSTAGLSRELRVVDEVSLFSLPLVVDTEWRDYHYEHLSDLASVPPDYCQNARSDPGCVTLVGHLSYQRLLGFGQAYVPSKTSIDQDVDVHIGIKILDPRLYVGVGYGYRRLDDIGPPFYGFGFGIDKLPSLDHAVSIEASGWEYATMRATYHGPLGARYGALSGAPFGPQYNVLAYRAGVTLTTRIGRYFWELGELGDRGFPNGDAPGGFSHHAIYLGGGWRL